MFSAAAPIISICIRVLAITRKDRTEFFCTRRAKTVRIRDSLDRIRHKSTVRKLTAAACADAIVAGLYGMPAGNCVRWGGLLFYTNLRSVLYCVRRLVFSGTAMVYWQ